jgi:hypothetical protein
MNLPFKTLSIVGAVAIVLSGCGGSDDDATTTANGPIPLTVPKATCATGDVQESGLQGQVPASVRAAGFKGFNCNLTLQGQSRGDGASWQHAFFQDGAQHRCYYYDTSSATANRTHTGVVTIDATDPTKPTPSAYLTTVAMIDPWESLKVNTRRALLGAVNALNGNGGPQIDLYDLSGDCRQPQLMSSMAVGQDTTGTTVSTVAGVLTGLRGHEGSFSPDGLTYYASNLSSGYVYPIDITNSTQPKLLGTFIMPGTVLKTHGLSISDDGTRGYFTIFGSGAAQVPAGSPATNGVVIADIGDFQSRKANPQMRVISTLILGDGSAAQHTIAIKIKGKPFLVEADEGGAGGNSATGWAAACAAGLPAWNMARLIDISDETKPAVASKLQLEMNDPAKCAQVIPDLAGESGFTYGAHYCSVDNKQEATTLACGYFESGIRVFDIRDPLRPKEIAYYNPAAVTTPSPGSQNNKTTALGRPDHCSAQVKLDASNGTLSTTCQDNGFLSLKFENGVWPFPTSTTPAGMQN